MEVPGGSAEVLPPPKPPAAAPGERRTEGAGAGNWLALVSCRAARGKAGY